MNEEFLSMRDESKMRAFKDSGERRLSIDRRQFAYSFYIPERRAGWDRRTECSSMHVMKIQSDS
jgi:hypothetical protein